MTIPFHFKQRETSKNGRGQTERESIISLFRAANGWSGSHQTLNAPLILASLMSYCDSASRYAGAVITAGYML